MPQPEADRLVQDAALALAAGEHEPAEAALSAALRADPSHPMALTKLAEIALQRQDHASATVRLQAALAREPRFAPAWGALSHAYWIAGRRQDALDAIRRAVHIQPPNAKLRLQLAQLTAWMGYAAEARRALAPLLDHPGYDTLIDAAAISMLGEIAIAEGRFNAADTHLQQALRRLPALQATRMMLGMNQLRLGQFAEGWANYAERERIADFRRDGYTAPPGTTWEGQDISGQSMLVVDDQGHGDAIQFFRYLPLLNARGPKHITLHSFAPLVPLFAEAAPYATVLAQVPEDAQFDYVCTSSSLPRWFGTTLQTIPVHIPYLQPPRGLASTRPAETSLQVGLAWAGDERHMRDHLRSIPAEIFLRLTDQPGIAFHSLQRTVRRVDLPALDARPAISRDIETTSDFAATAALVAELDLVITVDTAVAHLAGALGKPVWILLHVAPDWRWMSECTDSPWYHSARLFRMTPQAWTDPSGCGCEPSLGGAANVSVRPRDETGGVSETSVLPARGWSSVIDQVAEALRQRAAG